MSAVEHQIDTREGEETAPSAADVSVIIVSWNSGEWIGRCVASLAAAAGDLSCDTLILDNASADGSSERARNAAGERTTVIDSPTNRGFGGGINDLLPLARGRYILLLNPDCEPEPRSIETLVRHLDDTGAAGAAPLLIGEGGESQRAFQLRRFPTLRSFVADALLIDELRPGNRVSTSHRYAEIDITVPVAIEQPAGAALLLRREVVEKVGRFDERFSPAWFEDVDYCRRIAEAGGELHLVPTARFRHGGGASVDVMGFGRFLELWYRNLYRYTEKWMSRGEVEVVRWSIVVGMVMRAVAAMLGLGARRAGGRREAFRLYTRILGQAWRRWDAKSQSS